MKPIDKDSICLVIGHSAYAPGARNLDAGVTEFQFNWDLAIGVYFELLPGLLYSKTTPDDDHLVFSGSMGPAHDSRGIYVIERNRFIWPMIRRINQLQPALTLFFHANAYAENPGEREASGSEVLVPRDDPEFPEMAEAAADITARLSLALDIPDRGFNPIPNVRGQRGRPQLYGVKTGWRMLLETFFIDNNRDLEQAEKNCGQIIDILAGFIRWFSDQKRR